MRTTTPFSRVASKLESLRHAIGWLRSSLPWKFFFASCVLTGAMLFPHAGVGPVVAGMLLAGLIQLVWAIFRER